jgi:2-phospho-L-lactate transferase/gluconeogenesis factor (CofD/UPF0052 family)
VARCCGQCTGKPDDIGQTRARREETVAEAPRVVAFGGGIGLALLRSGLRQTSGDGVCGVVTSLTTAGRAAGFATSSGSHRPGDIRRCVVALAERRRLAEVFEYR